MINTKKAEPFRVIKGAYKSSSSDGANGMFIILKKKRQLYCVVSDQMGWEHVSVSAKTVPTWDEMCFIKSIFWELEDYVIQFHPAETEYVNCHPNCLHLWRPDVVFPVPPSFMVGPK